MTPGKRDMSALALELVGEFSKLQVVADHLVSLYVEKHAPSLAAFLNEENVLTRLPDRQRPRLVTAIAKELGTAADVSNFGDVFDRVKHVRDFAAHGTYTERVGPNKIVLWNNYMTGPSIKRTGIRKSGASLVVTRSLLTNRLRESRWLIQHVHFITGSSDLTNGVHIGGVPVRFAKPPARPSDWNGELFAS
ncbi:hypothetical protein ACTXG5_15530 [Mycobacterium sp. Dal123C01]|uniref:hypothetical protein n=1 Tax=Mycobacterium sp. Dal123C01 TaxID=3457577 RepID=UPI00403EB284